MTADDQSRLERLARAGRTYALISEVTRDPDPAPKHELLEQIDRAAA